jgi:hypothetical protein
VTADTDQLFTHLLHARATALLEHRQLVFERGDLCGPLRGHFLPVDGYNRADAARRVEGATRLSGLLGRDMCLLRHHQPA